MFSDNALSSLRWVAETGQVEIIDQTLLPHTLQWQVLDSLEDYCLAISSMQVRGAPLIGVTAAFGLAHALAEDPSTGQLERASAALLATRPTAVNLRWALTEMNTAVAELDIGQRAAAALAKAQALRAEDIATCSSIGDHGVQLLRDLLRDKGGNQLNVMTHCNAGWLAAVHWGTALAPVYKAHAEGMDVHVWVSETRPRNQGINLTAWELQRAGVPYTIVVDNSCGWLMQQGQVDCVIVGSDRTAANGDVCNKVGTYLKGLAAQANALPFYVALPESTIDWQCASGMDIPIENRSADEVLFMSGVDGSEAACQVRLAAASATASNPAFDITPASLVNALITEHGVFEASRAGLAELRHLLGESG